MTDEHSDLILEAISARLGTSQDLFSIDAALSVLESEKKEALKSAETYRNKFFKARRQLRRLEELVGTLEAEDEPPREKFMESFDAVDCPNCGAINCLCEVS